jgi:DNA adenine methylase
VLAINAPNTMIGPLAYIGGKRRLAKTLTALLPEHTTYVEPFAGGAQVFFSKPPSAVEVLNDLNSDVVNFFRVVQLHEEELVRYLEDAIVSRSLYDLYQRQDPTTLTDIQKAARFLYLQKNSFGGKVTQQNYHYCVTKAPNYNLESLPESIRSARKRLARVQLECWPYERIIERYDRETTCFYIDPPYVGVALYRYNFDDADFERLADRLASIKGKFLLSINDHPVARAAFARFNLREIAISYTATQSVPKVKELIFSNYPLPEIVEPVDVV